MTFGVVDPDAAPRGERDAYRVTPAALGQAAFSGDVLTYTASTPGTELVTVTVTDASGNTDVSVLPVTVNPAGVADTNHDGLSDAQASAMGLDPAAAGGDTDGDGVGDALEAGNPLAPVDRDGDRVIDALEYGAAAADPARLVFVVSRPAAARLGLAGLAGRRIAIETGPGAALRGRLNGDYGIPLYDKASAAKGDSGYGYPFGLLDYSVVTTAAQVKVTVTLPAGVAVPPGALVRKQDGGGRWRNLPGAVLDRQHNTVTLTLGDNDGFDGNPSAGVIRDPLGVAVALPVSTAAEAPSNAGTPSGAGGGGGAMGPLSAMAGLMSLWVAGYRRRRRAAVIEGGDGCVIRAATLNAESGARRSGPWPSGARRPRR